MFFTFEFSFRMFHLEIGDIGYLIWWGTANMNHKHNIYTYIEYSGGVLLHIARYGSISSIQMLTPAAGQRGPAQGKVTQLNLSVEALWVWTFCIEKTSIFTMLPP